MKKLWEHLSTCNFKNCKFSKCLSSRCILNHYRICKDKNMTAKCEVCGPVIAKLQAREAAMAALKDKRGDAPSAMDGSLLSSNIFGGKGNTNIEIQSSIATLRQGTSNDNTAVSGMSTNGIMNNSQSNEKQLEIVKLHLRHLQELQRVLQNSSSNAQGGETLSMIQSLMNETMTNTNQTSRQNGSTSKKKESNSSDQNQTISALTDDDLHALEDFNVKSGGVKGSTSPIDLSAFNNDDILDVGSYNKKDGKSTAVPTLTPSTQIKRIGEKRPRKHIDIDNSTNAKSRKVDVSVSSTSRMEFTEKCLSIVNMLLGTDEAWLFRDPVDPKELNLPDYFEIITEPMDLGLVKRKLLEGSYKKVEFFAREVRLVFSNAILYNGEDSDVGKMAVAMKKLFEEQFQKI